MVIYMNDATTYRVTDAPKFASMTAYDCHECGHPELGRPVFVTNGTAVLALGSGCAARLVGGDAALGALMFDALDDRHKDAVRWLGMFRPARITNRLRSDLAERYGVTLDVDAVVDTYKLSR